jgi:hypothetical protein
MTDPTADHQTLMAALRQALQDCAVVGATVTYQELARRTSFPSPHAIHRLTLLLEAMVREDHAAGRPLLATVAVSRTTGIPGRGFFQLLTELGRYDGPDQGPEAAAQHARELEAALAQWAKGGSS